MGIKSTLAELLPAHEGALSLVPGEQLQGLCFREQTPRAEWHLGLAPGRHVCGFTAVSLSLLGAGVVGRAGRNRASVPPPGRCRSHGPRPLLPCPPWPTRCLSYSLHRSPVPSTVKRNNSHHGGPWLGLRAGADNRFLAM